MALVCGAAGAADPEEGVTELPALAVIAQTGAAPLSVELDPRAPAQPIPAQDGADILRAIPGFSVIRKGGTDGDPVLRGMAGSRLGILIDGETILGGCGMRMDPTTAYVFPQTLDRVTVLKGPQTVLHGPGASAGVVLFERMPRGYPVAALEGGAALTLGAFARRDGALELRGGDPRVQFQLLAAGSESGDYRDGDGRRVASAYRRWSLNGALGWTPGRRTLVELTGVRSDAEAAYADRAMDGVAFARHNLGLRLRHAPGNGPVEVLEVKVFFNYIDHVMDNYTLRPFAPTALMPHPAVSNPDRETWGGRAAVTLAPGDAFRLTAGLEHQANRHTLRRTRNQDASPYQALPRLEDATFALWGAFAEGTWRPRADTRLVGGLRLDAWAAEDARATIAVGMADLPNPTAGHRRHSALPSGFLRLERDLGAGTAVHAGLGHTRRFPDYWELFNKEAPDSISAFHTSPERTTQLDVGLTRRAGPLTASVAVFANRAEDFILIESQFAKPAVGGARAATVARPVDTRALGGEGTLGWRIAPRWLAEAALAYTRGDNRTDGLPLAQQPPLEGRLSLRHTAPKWSAGALLRLVARQERHALNQGNIVGQDLGPTPGFAVLSLNAAWRPAPRFRITAGVDNVLDKAHAEHLSRAGAPVAGFPPPAARVTEPGRGWWVAGGASF